MNSVKGKHGIVNLLKACLIPVALYLLLLLLIPNRVGNLNSILSMFSLAVVPTIIAYGVHFGFVSGLMDFSVGSRLVLSGMCAAIGGYYGGLPGMLAAALVASLLLAAVVGGLFAGLRIPSIVISLGSLMVFEIGSVYLVRYCGKLLPEISTGQYIKAPENLLFLGKAPYNFIILILIGILFDVANRKTKIANQARVVGSDELIARNIGINPMRVKFSTYLFGSVFLALASVQSACYSSAVGYAQSLTSMSMVFKPMMAVIIGISLSGLVRHSVGIFIGSLCLSIMFTGIIALGWPDSLQNIFLGIFLTGVLALPTIQRALADSKRRRAAKKRFEEGARAEAAE
jgi:ribose transport system permease protein